MRERKTDITVSRICWLSREVGDSERRKAHQCAQNWTAELGGHRERALRKTLGEVLVTILPVGWKSEFILGGLATKLGSSEIISEILYQDYSDQTDRARYHDLVEIYLDYRSKPGAKDWFTEYIVLVFFGFFHLLKLLSACLEQHGNQVLLLPIQIPMFILLKSCSFLLHWWQLTKSFTHIILSN